MIGWAIKLSEFDVTYERRGYMKAQVLADFVNELSPNFGDEKPSKNNRDGARIIIKGPCGVVIKQSIRFDFKASNNQAKYEVFLISKGDRGDKVNVKEQFIVGNKAARGLELIQYLDVVKEPARTLEKFTLLHVPHQKNERVDLLAKLANNAPNDLQKAKRMKREAAKYVLVGVKIGIINQLYKRGFSFPLLRSLGESEAERAFKEIHEGMCGSHIGGRVLASKITPPGQLHSITYPWPFYMWGVDILGLFPLALGQVMFLLVVVDYFIKWIEVEAVASILVERVRRFYWKKIICLLRVSVMIVIDNDT
ncbi:hypothetical protein CR513_41152, partial [Mucuna pruriens]